ncbi:hypothetical protein ACNSOS_02635 [Aliarcobacter vitoriensis]|uniref:Uncharacterized protein n=1 Tax=Aliarcobacter vitoriensis TaxID=2011099 RepID=A0A366MQJ0_9BACT|nr:hypothetical protein [Aliarcobacter vitoriensis]RBQ28307.1 hypothetical protein CRU91_10025 [Aliarcobacter vitoriensis]RBQ30865.1 hypothetical protein CRU92_10120 [Arcobacter sp. FW59]
MITHFAKFARTNKSLIVFSNSFSHIEVFKKFYNVRVKPKEFGFLKINEDRVCLLEEDLKCDLIQGKTDALIRNKLLSSFAVESRYIITSTKFIIFPRKFSFKRVANRLFTDYVIQGAGEVTFEKNDNEILIKCFGGAKDLNIKSREIDALILKDELEANCDE